MELRTHPDGEGGGEDRAELIRRLRVRLGARLQRCGTRDVIHDLGLSTDPTCEEVDEACTRFTRSYDPARFDPLGDPGLDALAQELYQATMSALERLRKQARRSRRARDSVRMRVIKQPPAEPRSSGTLNLLQQREIKNR